MLSGCSGAVEVTLPAQATSPVCRLVAAAWPASVADRRPVATAPEHPAVRAWGDPAIIARCGVRPPGPTTADCLDVSGVDWVVEQLSDGARFTTYGREPAIEVLVPSAYRPEPLLLPAFAAAAEAAPTGERRCY